MSGNRICAGLCRTHAQSLQGLLKAILTSLCVPILYKGMLLARLLSWPHLCLRAGTLLFWFICPLHCSTLVLRGTPCVFCFLTVGGSSVSCLLLFSLTAVLGGGRCLVPMFQQQSKCACCTVRTGLSTLLN